MKKKKLSKNRVLVQEQHDIKDNKKNKLNIIFVGTILFLMVFSIFAVKLFGGNNDQDTEKTDYNGFEVVNKGNYWSVIANNIEYGFEYPPQELEHISSLNLKNEPLSGKVYILFDPEITTQNSQEVLRLRQFLSSKGVLVSLACTKEEGCGDIPIMDCRNSNKAVYLRKTNTTQIFKEDNCIVLEYASGEEIKVINKFMYGILGVTNG